MLDLNQDAKTSLGGAAKAMRDVFINGLCERMKKNKRIFFLSADFGSPALDRLREEYADRFINVGIAEQNMINISAGLALEGFDVYAYAITPFITMRDYEQVRLHLAISSQIRPVNVNLIGVGAGLSYDVAGPTHHGLEDLAIMRLLPNMAVFSPSDWRLVEKFIDFSIENKSPKYLRFDSKPLPEIYENPDEVDLKKGFHELIKGEKIALVSTGYMTQTALAAAKAEGDVGLIDVFMLKPLDEDALSETLKKYDCLITIEEGFIGNGGLDGLILNVLADRGHCAKVKRMGFKDKYVFDLGGRKYLHRLNGLDEEGIIKEISLWKQ
ncbi:MAG: transketolase [Candidatus Wolfebacteria bacterium]|nr:transketolase [Candidatus Wolfebacteria bacterium]